MRLPTCLLVCIGGIAAAFGLTGLLGFIPHLELEFFGIELNDQRGLILVRWKTKGSRY